MTEFQAGRILADRYQLVSLIGQGGMGSVWRAEHLTLGSAVAVKLIDPQIAHSKEAQARFVREARAAASLRSPHVVQVLDYGVDEVPFIVMEMMVGESLSERLERVGKLSPAETARILTDVARALAKAHEAGIVHRDLKPDNVFLVENDDVEVAKVLDFGVARVSEFSAENAGMTSTGAVLGTPYYMSPEQAEGLKVVDHRTDIWALTVMAYECLLGARPFTGDSLGGVFLAICVRDIPVPSHVGQVPTGFDEWFHKGTSRALEQRFATAREAASELRAICLGESAQGRLSGPDDVAVAASTGEQKSDARWAGRTDATRRADATRTGEQEVQGRSQVESATVPGLANTAIEFPLPRHRGLSAVVWMGALVVGLGVLGFVFANRLEPADDPEQDRTAELEGFVPGPASDTDPEPVSQPSAEPDGSVSQLTTAQPKPSHSDTSARPKVPAVDAATLTKPAVAPAPKPARAPVANPSVSPRPSPAAPHQPQPSRPPQPSNLPAPSAPPAPRGPVPVDLGI